jgi:hypothetical protein
MAKTKDVGLLLGRGLLGGVQGLVHGRDVLAVGGEAAVLLGGLGRSEGSGAPRGRKFTPFSLLREPRT